MLNHFSAYNIFGILGLCFTKTGGNEKHTRKTVGSPGKDAFRIQKEGNFQLGSNPHVPFGKIPNYGKQVNFEKAARATQPLNELRILWDNFCRRKSKIIFERKGKVGNAIESGSKSYFGNVSAFLFNNLFGLFQTEFT